MSIQHTPLGSSQELLTTRVPIALTLMTISAFDPWFCQIGNCWIGNLSLKMVLRSKNLDAIPKVPSSMALHYLCLLKMTPAKDFS